MSEAFWLRLESLIETCELVIDRPQGSTHPRYRAAVYPLDYGYLRGTSGGDGRGIDVWRGSLPEGRLDAVVCTVDAEKRDAEVKLLIGCSATDKATILAFLGQGAMAAILVERDGL